MSTTPVRQKGARKSESPARSTASAALDGGDARSWRRAGTTPAASETTAPRPWRASALARRRRPLLHGHAEQHRNPLNPVSVKPGAGLASGAQPVRNSGRGATRQRSTAGVFPKQATTNWRRPPNPLRGSRNRPLITTLWSPPAGVAMEPSRCMSVRAFGDRETNTLARAAGAVAPMWTRSFTGSRAPGLACCREPRSMPVTSVPVAASCSSIVAGAATQLESAISST